MNLSGVVFAKGWGKGASATETPLLNGTKEDMQSLNGALIHLQESVVHQGHAAAHQCLMLRPWKSLSFASSRM
jgi:hypothetical protein